MNAALREILKKKDQLREYKKEYSQRKNIKRKQMQKVVEQIKRGIDKDKKAIKEGKDYTSGIAIQAKKAAQKNVKQTVTTARKHNKTLPALERVCKFYPKYCQ